MKIKIINKRNTIILSIIVFIIQAVFDKTTSIFLTGNPLGSLAYAFGYVYGFAFIISIIVAGITKLFRGDFQKSFYSTFFFMLILIIIVFIFQNYIQ